METVKPTKKIILAATIIALFFLIIIASLLLMKTNHYPKKEKNVSPPVVLKGEKRGMINLSTAKDTISLAKKEKVTVIAKVDSEGKDIVSFDLILKFDKQNLVLTETKSMVTGFSLFKKPLPDGEVITGVKKIGQKKKVIFNDNQLVKLTFTPKKKGSYTISVIPTDNTNRTQFVNSQTKIFYPKLSRLSINVI